MNPAWQIGVFAKHWTPGQVKTRLAPSVGEEEAAGLAREFLASLLTRLAALPCRRVLGFAPPRQRDAFAALAGPAWELRPQVEGDLGQRMQAYFDEALADGCQRAALVGADCPTLPASRLGDALRSLDEHDIVLGPSEDGGYYLIAARQRTPVELLQNIAWGGADVLRDTLHRAQQAQISVGLLAPWRDVDRWEDLGHLQRELAGNDDPQLSSLRRAVDAALRRPR